MKKKNIEPNEKDLREVLEEAIHKYWKKNPKSAISENDLHYALHEVWERMFDNSDALLLEIAHEDDFVEYDNICSEAHNTLTSDEMTEYSNSISAYWEKGEDNHSSNEKVENLLERAKIILKAWRSECKKAEE